MDILKIRNFKIYRNDFIIFYDKFSMNDNSIKIIYLKIAHSRAKIRAR